MWLFTRDGFFSAIQDNYCKTSEVIVRTRVKRDLLRLLIKIGRSDDNIITLPNADYRYRIKLAKQEWAKYLSSEAMNLDYSNVKDAITDGLCERSEAYYACWTSLYQFQMETAGV